MRALGQSFHTDYVETNHQGAPARAPLQEEAHRAQDFALFVQVYRCQRAPEIDPSSLPHFDDRQHAIVQADQIDLAAFATQVAREHLQTLRLQMLGRELLGGGTLKAGIHGHAGENARARWKRQQG